MSLVPLQAVLWRHVNKATFDTLTGKSKGQYDIRLTKHPKVEDFFAGLSRQDVTSKGGYTLTVPIEPFDGPDPVPATTLEIRFMGPGSERKDWYIRAQRPDTAYALWRPGRGVPIEFDEERRDFVLLLRDTLNRFHARWLRDEALQDVPEAVRSKMLAKEIGVMTWPM